jgi:DNA repair exonuclease SbcCD nuclease subunit
LGQQLDDVRVNLAETSREGGKPSVRFLHTSDWQLGMTRHFLGGGDQATFAQARIDAVVRLAEVARDRACSFVVVAGDVFETNQPDRRTIGRALDALRTFDVPVYLLPGNHDPYDPGSVYGSAAWTTGCPDHVEVLTDDHIRCPVEGVEVLGAPWTSKRPVADLLVDTCAALPADGALRVVVGHGPADLVTGDLGQPGVVRVGALETAIAAGQVSYVALGDRHSTLSVGDSGRIWYAGAPEPTSYREQDAGNALVVDLAPHLAPGSGPGPATTVPRVERVPVGRWRFREVRAEVADDHGLTELFAALDALPDKARTIVKVKVAGTLSLCQAARLEQGLEAREHVLGALEHPERHVDITVVPEPDDLASVPLTGYAAAARDRLLARAREGDDEPARSAADALGLLVRLTGGGTR